MLKISKPLSVGTTKSYYKEEFTKAENAAYYTQTGHLQGEWHGKLAEEFELKGPVTEAQYDRLVEGQHPHTAEQLIEHRDTVRTQNGEEVAHRAAWDVTFGAPKSVSATALVGGDEHVREAHRQAVKVALDAMEEYVQARIGGDHPAQTTGNFVVALFEHDTARPVGGGAPDPHLHTHAVTFNMTRDDEGQVRSLQTAELFRIQQYATAVYQSELSSHLVKLGYQLTTDEGYAPEIRGYNKEYLDSISQRRDEINAKKEELGVSGAEAGERIAKQTRANKQLWDSEELREEHRDQAKQFGNQPDQVVQAAQQHQHQSLAEQERLARVSQEITHAKDSLSERQSVFDRYEIARETLRQGSGIFTLPDVEKVLDDRVNSGELIEVSHWRGSAPGARYTTPEAIRLEQNTIQFVIDSKQSLAPIQTKLDWNSLLEKQPTITADQKKTIEKVLASTDRVYAIQGGAGTGKSFALGMIRDVAEEQGYEVKGLAPTSSATNNLKKDGLNADTLQAHLAQGVREPGQKPTLYLLDESSLAGIKAVNDFLHRLTPEDRVVLIGDTRQHQSVEAGRIFHELQDAGMNTSKMNEIVRQKNPELKAAIQDFSEGKIAAGLQKLVQQDRVHELQHRSRRYETIARKYAEDPKNTLVISPDNQSRQDLNRVIRTHLQNQGVVQKNGFEQSVLVTRQSVTGADRRKAVSYQIGNIVRFEHGSKKLGVDKKTYAKVLSHDREKNEITLQLPSGKQLTYNPNRFYGVQLYTVEHRQFSVGDRVQFTAPWKEQGIANRQLGTIDFLDSQGNASVHLDGSDQRVNLNLDRMKHLDHGYTVTSYSSQSLTVNNTLLNIETGDPNARGLLGRELTYVASSRARDELQIFTDNTEKLGFALNRTHEKGMALAPEEIQSLSESQAQKVREHKPEKTIDYSMGIGF